MGSPSAAMCQHVAALGVLRSALNDQPHVVSGVWQGQTFVYPIGQIVPA